MVVGALLHTLRAITELFAMLAYGVVFMWWRCFAHGKCIYVIKLIILSIK